MTILTLSKTYCTICDTVKNAFNTVLEARAKRSSRNATYKALQQLSNAELNDIGICRGDINYIADGGKVYRGRFGYTTDKENELV